MITEKPLVTVIVPVYNKAEFLEQCFASLDAQDYAPLEILLIDDGSTDDSLAVCRAYAERKAGVRVVHQENGGPSAARNRGLAEARGELISFVDADDTVDPDYISYLYELMLRYQTDFSLCQHRVIHLNGKVRDFGQSGDRVLSTHDVLENLFYFNTIDTSACMKLYRRSLFDGITYPEGRIFEDLAVTYQVMLRTQRIACGLESKYQYRMHEETIINGSFSPKQLYYAETTDRTVAGVCAVYPDLAQAGLTRAVRARFTVLDFMINSREKGYPEEQREMIGYIRSHAKEVLQDPKAGRSLKLAVILMKIGYPLYRLFWQLYRKSIT